MEKNQKKQISELLPFVIPEGERLTTAQVAALVRLRQSFFINPLTDFGFKKLLASEENKDILIRFLNAFLSDTIGVITDLTFLPTEHIGISDSQKVVRFDIYCEIQNGDHIIVEMQNSWQKFYANRSLMYTSRSLSQSMVSGQLLYDIPRTISFNIMGFNMPEFRGRDGYFWHVQLKDNDNEIFSDRIGLYFVELPKFAAQKNSWDFSDERVKWLYAFTHVGTMTEDEFATVGEAESDPVFRKFYEECKVSNLTDMEKEKYVKSVLEYEDVQEALECVRENSLQEGRAEERTEWLAERRKIILNMLSRGFDIHTVAEVADMTEDEIREITD